MQKNILILTIGIIAATLLLLLGCAKPNMRIESHWYDKADIGQKKKVALTAGYHERYREPNEREKAAFPKVGSKIEKLGFQLVDSVSNADLILNVKIYENLSFEFIGHLWSTAQWTSPASVTSNGDIYWRRGMNSGGEIIKEKGGFDILVLRLCDRQQTDKRSNELWYTSVCTRSEYLDTDFDKILDLAIAQYGKNSSEYGVYRPTTQPEKIAAR